MPMYADIIESGQPPALDFVLPYEQPDDPKDSSERLNEIEQLAEDLYGDGEKAPSSQRRVYTLEEYAPVLTGRLGKRKRQLDTVEEGDEHDDPEDDRLRPDALLLHGEASPPISKLSTEKIFEYVATYCDKPPISLEWIDDRTTVIIFESADVAHSAYTGLVKQSPEEPETLVPAHPVPKKMWPPEAQLDHNLSRGTALSGIMRIRRARFGDRKLKGARKRSEWYGTQRTKRTRGGGDDLDAELDDMKRRREAGEDGDWEKERAAALDRELDALAARKDGDEEAMEVESTSRLQSRLGPRKENRQIAPLPRRRGRGRETREERPQQTQEDLDAELEAFMKARE